MALRGNYEDRRIVTPLYKYLRNRGWVLPGYKYLGPFNSLNKGEPTSVSDAAALVHDKAYASYLEKRKNPYVEWNSADETFLQNVGGDWGGYVGAGFFRAKKLLRRHNVIGEIEDEPESTMPEESIQTREGSGNELGLKETPVDHPYDVFRGPPDYTFASLPYHSDGLVTDLNTWGRDHVYRMTSPYDPLVTIDSVDMNAGSGTQWFYSGVNVDANDTTIRPANYYNYYSSLYKYYHTISCRYKITIENFGEPLWGYLMFYNEDLPPVAASNIDIQTWHGVETKFIASQYTTLNSNGYGDMDAVIPSKVGTAIIRENEEKMEVDATVPADKNMAGLSGRAYVNNNNGSSYVAFQGEYRPGDFTREIRLDEKVENWTAINANPKLQERLLLRIRPQSNRYESNSANSGGDDMNYRVRVSIDYLAEFKELNPALRYPVVRQPLTVTLNDTQEFTS